MENNIDKIREKTMHQIEKSERNYRAAFYGVAAVEAIFIAAFLLMADFSNRMHVLLLISTVAIYTIVGFGLIVLGLHVNRNTLRILHAIEFSNSDEK